MQRKHVYSTLVPDALALIAACTESRPLMELAIALRAVVSGTVLLLGDRVETISRIARDLTNKHWNVQAHVTLTNPMVRYYAKAFCQACIQAVPLTAENPKRDSAWQARVKVALTHDPILRAHAKQLLGQIRLRVTPAQVKPVQATPVQPVNTTPPPKRDKAELYALAKKFAEELVRRREAQKVRAAQANATPAQQPAERAQAEALSSIADPASTPKKRPVFRNVAVRARYASMSPILGLYSSFATPELHPGFS